MSQQCPSCGKILKSWDKKFCSGCGEPLAAASARPGPETTEAPGVTAQPVPPRETADHGPSPSPPPVSSTPPPPQGVPEQISVSPLSPPPPSPSEHETGDPLQDQAQVLEEKGRPPVCLVIDTNKGAIVGNLCALDFQIASLRPGRWHVDFRAVLDEAGVDQTDQQRRAEVVLDSPGIFQPLKIAFVPRIAGEVVLGVVTLRFTGGRADGTETTYRAVKQVSVEVNSQPNDAGPRVVINGGIKVLVKDNDMKGACLRILSDALPGGLLQELPSRPEGAVRATSCWIPLVLAKALVPPPPEPILKTWRLAWPAAGLTDVTFLSPETKAEVGRGEPREIEDLDFAFAKLPWNDPKIQKENQRIHRRLARICCTKDGRAGWEEKPNLMNPTPGAGLLVDGKVLSLAGNVLDLDVTIRRGDQGLAGFPRVHPAPSWAAGDLRYLALTRRGNCPRHRYILLFGPASLGRSEACDIVVPGGDPLWGWIFFDAQGELRFQSSPPSSVEPQHPVLVQDGGVLARGEFQIHVRRAAYADFLAP